MRGPAAPRDELARILDFTDLKDVGAPTLDDLNHAPALPAAEAALSDEVRTAMWSEVGEVAEKFAWQRPNW